MIVITDPQFFVDESKYINALFENGLDVLHIRKPDASIDEVRELIMQIKVQYHYKIMIHSHYELRKEFNIRGIHFPGDSKHLIPQFADCNCKKSQSIHEIQELQTVHPLINYVFLSPLFPSISKAGYSKPWNFMDLILALKNSYPFQIIPLGGINAKNLVIAKEFGFREFAVLGSIWEPVKVGCTVEEMVEIFNQYKGGRY
jgi:thiamine-phosphate pyrophosphorylase